MRTLSLPTSDLSRRQRLELLAQQRQIRRLARDIVDEPHLRRVLSDTREPTMRRQVFLLISPWLRFELSDELKLELKAIAGAPGGIGG